MCVCFFFGQAEAAVLKLSTQTHPLTVTTCKLNTSDNQLVAHGQNLASRTVRSGPWLDSKVNIK